ncbi:hypothetical protein Q8A67_010725 [Cirrhinus molitorella]|nr:hypothetical protein Q8A67_010725 [Cirrhinus molitorella]
MFDFESCYNLVRSKAFPSFCPSSRPPVAVLRIEILLSKPNQTEIIRTLPSICAPAETAFPQTADGRRACLRCCGFFLVAFGWSRATRRSLSSDTLQDSIMKDGMANNSTASISQARKAVEQLKMEACMDRIKVSKAAADLMAYCDAHIREDPLIVPVPASENPFREKKFFCTIL